MNSSDAVESADASATDTYGADADAFTAYLSTNRTFNAPAVAAATASIPVTVRNGSLRILDAGTGAGGALSGLVDLGRNHGSDPPSVLAVDVVKAGLDVARDQLETPEVAASTELRQADLREIAAEAAGTDDAFDVIWAADVVWPVTFDDPAVVVAELSRALTPGGTLALFTDNHYQSMFLPGHSRLERLIRTASEIAWGIPGEGRDHYELIGAWMRQAGLVDVRLQVFPIVAPTTEDPAIRDYLEQAAWPEMLHAVQTGGQAAGMSPDDIEQALSLLDPARPNWIGADPDAFVVQPTLLWTGRNPNSPSYATHTGGSSGQAS